ncbi:hypothetical protein CHKEEEPN_4886 [Methylorubrum podarium]|nr:hypothetical protein CHKEEEPN_4886 [Methylorubrum podarium]
MAAGEIAKGLGLAAVETQEVGGAGHVDVEEGAAHQEVRGFGRDVLGELGQTLRGDDAGEPPLAPAAHQVGHGAEREAAGLVRHLARGCGCEELRLVHHHQHRVPERAVGIEQPAEEGGGGAHLVLGVEAFEREHDGDPVLAHAGGDAQQLGLVAVRLDHDVAVALGERDEIAFRVDDRLLYQPRALFEQAAQQVRLAGTGIALDEEARRQKLGEVHRPGPVAGPPQIDLVAHPVPRWRPRFLTCAGRPGSAAGGAVHRREAGSPRRHRDTGSRSRARSIRKQRSPDGFGSTLP